MHQAVLTGIHRTPVKRGALEALDSVTVIADRGIDGDHHQRYRSSRQVMLVEAEVLDELGLQPGDIREQLCVRGLRPLAAGDVLAIGDVRLEIVKPRVPCRVMDGVRPGLRQELEGRAGWCTRVARGGTITVGDRITRGRVDDPDWLHEYRAALAAFEASPPLGLDPAEIAVLQELADWNLHAARALAQGVHPAGEVEPAQASPMLGTIGEAYRLHDAQSTGFVEAARAAGGTAGEAWARLLVKLYGEQTLLAEA